MRNNGMGFGSFGFLTLVLAAALLMGTAEGKPNLLQRASSRIDACLKEPATCTSRSSAGGAHFVRPGPR